jgi:thymidylate synthase
MINKITARNPNEGLLLGYDMIRKEGKLQQSRAGDVFVLDGVTIIEFLRPTERVLTWTDRDCNPFFHFMEGLWMLGGRSDVDWICQFNKSFAQFSDDGLHFHGAYGRRWREWFIRVETQDSGVNTVIQMDQLRMVIDLLKKDPNDRRIVLQMWDPANDLGLQGKDFPCNLSILFRKQNDEKLSMTVFNRSNDMIWGTFGANAVHMSMLHEIVATSIGREVGTYYQVSNNFHSYVETYEKHKNVIFELESSEPYRIGEIRPYPMMSTDIDTWLQDLEVFLENGPIVGFRDQFFRRVATPIYQAWKSWKSTDIKDIRVRSDRSVEILEQCIANDWRMACQEWILRRTS